MNPASRLGRWSPKDLKSFLFLALSAFKLKTYIDAKKTMGLFHAF
jgi:hypothetical protein